MHIMPPHCDITFRFGCSGALLDTTFCILLHELCQERKSPVELVYGWMDMWVGGVYSRSYSLR